LTDEDLKLSSLFTPAQVVCHLENMTCHEIFRHLLELLGRTNHSFDVERAYAQILKRNSCGITFATPEVAVVHVRVEGLERLHIEDRYATVGEESPAIQVAKVMMRRNVRQVYVVRDKMLMGVITIQDFIHKVLRA
jgi:CBS domain-containing protein